jgi:hypothetical protein
VNSPHTQAIEVARCVSDDCLTLIEAWREPVAWKAPTRHTQRRDIMDRLITALLTAAILTGSVSFAAAYENDNNYSTRNAAAFYWKRDEARGGGDGGN